MPLYIVYTPDAETMALLNQMAASMKAIEANTAAIEENIMTGLTDLQASDAALATAVTNLTSAVTTGVTQIQALLAQLASNTEDPAVEAIAQDINAKIDTINVAAANLTAALATSTPTPAPAPAPTS